MRYPTPRTETISTPSFRRSCAHDCKNSRQGRCTVNAAALDAGAVRVAGAGRLPATAGAALPRSAVRTAALLRTGSAADNGERQTDRRDIVHDLTLAVEGVEVHG